MKNSTAFILILISIGLFYTFTSPEYTKVKALRTSAAEYKNVLTNVSKLIETRDMLLDKYQDIPKSEINKLDKILPGNVNTVELAVDLDSIAAKYGVIIKEVSVKDANDSGSSTVIQPTTGRPYDSAKVMIIVAASYEGFRNFIRDLEASQRIANVKDLSFRSQDDGSYEFQVTIETYWVK